jgi:hypothetical protein
MVDWIVQMYPDEVREAISRDEVRDACSIVDESPV